jgi:hypothetical protein
MGNVGEEHKVFYTHGTKLKYKLELEFELESVEMCCKFISQHKLTTQTWTQKVRMRTSARHQNRGCQNLWLISRTFDNAHCFSLYKYYLPFVHIVSVNGLAKFINEFWQR